MITRHRKVLISYTARDCPHVDGTRRLTPTKSRLKMQLYTLSITCARDGCVCARDVRICVCMRADAYQVDVQSLFEYNKCATQCVHESLSLIAKMRLFVCGHAFFVGEA